MDPRIRRCWEASEHGSQGAASREQGWKRLLGIWAFCYAPLSMAPASNSSPTPGPTLAAGEMVYGTADAVMRFQRAGRGDLSRLLQTNISRNSASAQSNISDTLRTLHTLRHSNPALGLAP
jgi:hypothetical protein